MHFLVPTGDGVFSPAARNIAPTTLRVRDERKGDANGRVYLISHVARDSSNNAGFACCSVVVPHDPTPPSIRSVNDQALAATNFCRVHSGMAPAGYFVVGD